MSEAAIRAENLGKRYRIGQRERYLALRDVLTRSLTAPFRWLARAASASSPASEQSIWALRNASFEVEEGDVLGIIGRNGSGKTTLLKILARITRPTAGSAEVRGQVGSLLEVGTGFHPELTGRDNIYLSGAILGMRKREIDAKFDEIVAFSELEKFIDTTVKYYSTGMHMRLAFAVAAHLEPEILLVDEVLAVGDAAFQKKCLGKMGDVARQGRTVLFVSHNMAAVTAICQRALLLDVGRLKLDGPAGEVALRYQEENLLPLTDGCDLSNVARKGTGKARFTSIRIERLAPPGVAPNVLMAGCDIEILASIHCRSGVPGANAAVVIYDSSGYRLIDVNTAQKGTFLTLCPGQDVQVRFVLREVLLKPGSYFLGLWLGRADTEEIDHIEYATTFSIVGDPDKTKHGTTFPGPYLCKFDLDLDTGGQRR